MICSYSPLHICVKIKSFQNSHRHLPDDIGKGKFWDAFD